MPAMTRGPLPPAVYWRRRLMLLAVVLAVAFAIVGVSGAFGPGGSSGQRAVTTSAQTDDTDNGTDPTDEPGTDTSGAAEPGGTGVSTGAGSESPAPEDPTATDAEETPDASAIETVEAEPDGPCPDGEVLVTPAARRPVAGSPVRFVLHLQTDSVPACTFDISPESVTIKITSGADEIWNSLECPEAIAERSVVVRRDRTTRVAFRWNSRRSDPECTNRTAWALPGSYHILVAALGSEPTDVQFKLLRP